QQEALRHFHRTFGDHGGAVTTLIVLPPSPGDDGARGGAPHDLSRTVFAPAVMHATEGLAAWLRARPAVDDQQVHALPELPNLHGAVIAPGFLADALARLEATATRHGVAADVALAAEARGDPLPAPVAAEVARYREAVAA